MVGNDVVDFKIDPSERSHGPVIMNPEGVGRIFARSRPLRWPLPEHYEPIESPIDNPLHPEQTHNPVVKRFKTRTTNTAPQKTVTPWYARPIADRALSLLDKK